MSKYIDSETLGIGINRWICLHCGESLVKMSYLCIRCSMTDELYVIQYEDYIEMLRLRSIETNDHVLTVMRNRYPTCRYYKKTLDPTVYRIGTLGFQLLEKNFVFQKSVTKYDAVTYINTSIFEQMLYNNIQGCQVNESNIDSALLDGFYVVISIDNRLATVIYNFKGEYSLWTKFVGNQISYIHKGWDEFCKTGLLLFINSFLHIFGWAIVVKEEDNKIIEVNVARTKCRGFPEDEIEKAYIDISKFMKANAKKLLEEAND